MLIRHSCDEPNFQCEKDIEVAVIAACSFFLEQNRLQHFHIRGFGLDCAFWVGNGRLQWIKMLEVKVFTPQSGRCAIGSSRGGKQVDLLFDDRIEAPRNRHELALTIPSIRWILGDFKREIGTPRYAMIDSLEAQEAASGGRIERGKYNNFRYGFFDGRWKTWTELVDNLEVFLANAS